jgi:bifunctional UDP-N-acetylglucosamine pyrophosphorylase/glucosamine-1-phosphate N-acetyltransferase
MLRQAKETLSKGDSMLEKNLQAVLLAGGRSTRFKTGKTKLLERICGQEMVLYATSLLERLGLPTTVLIGYEGNAVKDCIMQKHGSALNFTVQEEQKGTGHALLCTQKQWQHDHILVMNGDMPLITQNTLEQLVQKHYEHNASITFVTAHNADPSVTGYGRVVQEDHKVRIIEPKEFHGDTHEHCCVNAGIYLIKRDFLETSIHTLQANNSAQEFYLTDLIKIASDAQLTIKTVPVAFDEIRGVNDFKELWTVEQIKRSELISKWMASGVRFHAAQNVHIDVNVTIGAGSYIGNGVHIINNSHVGQHCIIECFSVISNTHIGNHTTIRAHSVVYDSTIGDQCSVGPFAHIEKDSRLEAHAVIGNFVHVKKSTLGSHSKAKHLAYLGDTNIGEQVNIGAGTITCNYDGVHKHTTTIEDNCFIGSNNTLVAPVAIGKNSYTAAGSVITNNVPQGALAIGRARQVNKEGYARTLHEKLTHAQNEADIPFIGALKTTDPSSFTEGT